MFSKDDARTVLGIIGNIVSLILFVSPLPTFRRIWKKRSVEEYSAAPYLATFVNCGLWVLYGLPMVHPHSTLVVTINGAGFVIEILYLSMFLVFAGGGKKRLTVAAILAAECAFLGVLAALVLSLARTTKLRSTVVGSICIAGNILMYAAPLSVMKMVIVTKSVEYMPFFVSLFSFFNGLCWSAYAFIRFDPFILAPNASGTLLGLAQLILYATFYKSTKKILADRKAQSEVGLVSKRGTYGGA
ncbi:bidirectional sugar transporter SWEET4-like [Andrographis paniculata]|uniref:bidirectional sugar transporter SWEET4-like n=1 Tax=Andrographis paniculata TaxID=175694 RepID=UPI0021E80955|nr:bidirectional sugar transporter SWEET4-like [Andrographis paniculata]